MCGGVDRCWSHDSSAVNTSICYFPCTASASTSRRLPPDNICLVRRDQAPPVDHRRTSSAARGSENGAADWETAASARSGSSHACRRRFSLVLCLVCITTALLIATVTSSSCKFAVLRVQLYDDGNFPREAGHFPLPVVNNAVRFVDAISSRFSRSHWLTWLPRSRIKLDSRIINCCHA